VARVELFRESQDKRKTDRTRDLRTEFDLSEAGAEHRSDDGDAAGVGVLESRGKQKTLDESSVFGGGLELGGLWRGVYP